MKLNPFRTAMVASAAQVPTGDLHQIRRKEQPWQQQAWRLWRVLGVLHYPTSFMAEQVMRLDWKVSVDGKDLSDDQSKEAIAAVTEPIGAAEVARRLALNLEVVGEVYYGRHKEGWKTISPTVGNLQEKLERLEPRIRGWLADPEDPDKPDSPVRAALDTAEEIRVMSALMRAQTRNRLAQRGALLFPSEVEFPEGDDFFANLQESMTAPIQDEHAASAVVPLYQKMPAEYIEKVKHLVLDFPYDEKLDERLDGAIKRLALSLNMPPEILLGLADVNRWNAFIIEASVYRAHIEPLGVNVGSIFAEAIAQAGELENVVVTPDPSDLLIRKREFGDVIRAVRMGAVGFKALREVLGYDEEDKPTPEDLRIIALLTRSALAASEIEGGSPGTPPSGREPVRTPEEIIESNGSEEAVTAAVEDDSDAALDKLASQMVDIDTRLISWLDGASEVALSQIQQHAEDTDVDTQGLVTAELERLGAAWERKLEGARRSLVALGIEAEGPEWEEAGQVSVDMLTDGLTDHVMENLSREIDDRPPLATPVLLLRRVLAVAGGSETAVVAGVLNPPPTFQDPQGFAIGVLSLKQFKDENIELVQWRFRYFPSLIREHPFEEHVAVDGQFLTAEGQTSDGFYPGDHRGCRCGLDPVFRRQPSPEGV